MSGIPTTVGIPVPPSAPTSDARNVSDVVRNYLDNHFKPYRDYVQEHAPNGKSTIYKAAYCHCLVERTISSVANALQIAPGQMALVNGIRITHDDIINWTGTVAPSSFRNIKAAVSETRKAVERLKFAQSSGNVLWNDQDKLDKAVLEVLLRTKLVVMQTNTDEVIAMERGEMAAVELSKIEWKKMIERVLSKYIG